MYRSFPRNQKLFYLGKHAKLSLFDTKWTESQPTEEVPRISCVEGFIWLLFMEAPPFAPASTAATYQLNTMATQLSTYLNRSP